MIGKVFVPQVPSRYDLNIKGWVPTVNLTPAETFGELEVLLPPEAGRMPPEELQKILSEKLDGITENDWLLATGDPVVIGITAAIAASRLYGHLRILRWNKQRKSYDPVVVQLDI